MKVRSGSYWSENETWEWVLCELKLRHSVEEVIRRWKAVVNVSENKLKVTVAWRENENWIRWRWGCCPGKVRKLSREGEKCIMWTWEDDLVKVRKESGEGEKRIKWRWRKDQGKGSRLSYEREKSKKKRKLKEISVESEKKRRADYSGGKIQRKWGKQLIKGRRS